MGFHPCCEFILDPDLRVGFDLYGDPLDPNKDPVADPDSKVRYYNLFKRACNKVDIGQIWYQKKALEKLERRGWVRIVEAPRT